MSTSGADNRPLGDTLLAAGWRQGALNSAPSVCFLWNAPSDSHTSETGESIVQQSRKVKSREQCVLITQDCDIQAAVDHEPYVEALLCHRETNREFLSKVDRNSARWFVIDPAIGLVAEAKYRLHLAKEALLALTPEPWPSGPERLERFIRWLARRYDRPTIPDRLVEAFQNPVEAALTRLDKAQPHVGAAFSRAVHEVRINLPSSENPPFDLQLVLLVKREGLSEEEADAMAIASEAIQASLDPKIVRLDPEARILTEEEMSLAEYFATRPLFLEYHTYKGDEIEGAEPYGRV
jgi:hypothetical protein